MLVVKGSLPNWTPVGDFGLEWRGRQLSPTSPSSTTLEECFSSLRQSYTQNLWQEPLKLLSSGAYHKDLVTSNYQLKFPAEMSTSFFLQVSIKLWFRNRFGSNNIMIGLWHFYIPASSLHKKALYKSWLIQLSHSNIVSVPLCPTCTRDLTLYPCDQLLASMSWKELNGWK